MTKQKYKLSTEQIEAIRDAYDQGQQHLREAKRITQKEIAKKFELTPETVSRVVADKPTKVDEDDRRLIKALHADHLSAKEQWNRLKPAALAEQYGVPTHTIKDIAQFKTHVYM